MAVSSFLDVCRFNPTLGGLTDWIYSSTVTGYQSPSSAGVVTATPYSYRAESATLVDWEIGQGNCTIAAGIPTFARTTIIASSTGSKVNFGAVPQVAIVALKEDLKAAPTRQIFTSSTGTYTTPAGCLYIKVRGIGGGGGGGGIGGSATSGGTGGVTTFGTSLLTGNGGVGGVGASTNASGGAGGTASGGSINTQGAPGAASNSTSGIGNGGASLFGGAGAGGIPGTVGPIAAIANTGSGGPGGGGGGGAGGYFEAIIASPASTYAYAVGAGGAASTGASGQNGLAGASGIIIVEEFYN